MKRKYITKEDIQLLNRCDKSLYLKYNHPEWKDEQSAEQMASLEKGKEVGEFAWSLFNHGGVKGLDVSKKNTVWAEELVIATKNALQKRESVLFEAGFSSLDNRLFCRTDILVNNPKGLKVIEVKSGTSLKPQYILDAAFQWKVIRESGYKGKLEFSIAYLNKDFVKRGHINPYELFKIEDITEEVIEKQETISLLLLRLQNILSKDSTPNINIGRHCWADYNCPFLGHCRKGLPERNIWNIGGIQKARAETMQKNGIIDFNQIPKDEALTKKQWIEVTATLEGKPHINLEKIQTFLDSLDLYKPHYYLDFETIAPPIPKYDGCKPYSNICFQFCLLYKNSIHDEVEERVDFLADPKSDPRRQFIETLLNATKRPGIIIAYHMSFEKGRLVELANLFEDLKSEINERISRLRDLAEPFAQRYYYHPTFNGSHSLKSVLPALVSDLSYDKLLINNGSMAMTNYSDLIKLAPNAQAVIKEALIDYCYLDVFGMVRIIEILYQLMNTEKDVLLRKLVRKTIAENYDLLSMQIQFN